MGAHTLETHAADVAALAASFAEAFGATGLAILAGLWHDLGKYQPAFQQRIRQETGYDPEAHLEQKPGKQPHAHAGALWALDEAFDKLPEAQQKAYGRILAYLIAGHHTGLPDWSAADGGQRSLEHRLQAARARGELKHALENMSDKKVLSPPDSLAERPPGNEEGVALWVRMLFSCLVDADFLDTEAFLSPDKATARGRYPTLAQLQTCLQAHMQQLCQAAPPSPVNRLRAQIYEQCVQAASRDKGIFTLTVPTGGGKTLASLAFALAHAQQHGASRIIYAIPYTSIIEQTADVFRRVFAPIGEEVVVEHHSNLDVADSDETRASRLATENWDAPLVVTTNVQLLESLFAARTSRCRKLHNLANAVIVLDEAQMLPPDFLAPILKALRLLTAHYGVTLVLCTATQPALNSRTNAHQQDLLKGLDTPTEIIADVPGLFAQMRRVQVQPLVDWQATTDWETIATRLQDEPCALAIVNTRKDCWQLWQMVPDAIHLSGLMCGQHRSDTIAHIKAQLQAYHSGAGQTPLRVISTQLVEAGVDLDFPVVYRAIAGLDAIAQAAGRCNREGRMSQPGKLYVFRPPTPPPPGLLRKGADALTQLFATGQLTDALAPDSYKRYFDLYYSILHTLDVADICQLEAQNARDLNIPFRTIADKCQLIPEATEAIVVPYIPVAAQASPVHAWLKLLASKPDENLRWIYRKLQRYTVNVYPYLFQKLQQQCAIYMYENTGLWVAHDKAYHAKIGLSIDFNSFQPEAYIY